MNTLGNIPNPSAPFLGPDGRISQVWWQLLVSLFSRTGSEQGFDFAAAIQRVADLEAQNVALTAQVVSLSTLNAALQTQVAAIPIPVSYSNVTIAGTPRKIPYYSN